MAKLSPTQLTLRHLRRKGYTAAVTERWNPFAKIRQDLFGFVDVLGVGNGETIAVQSTSWGNRLSRVKKMKDDKYAQALADCRDANWTIVVHGWRKVKNKWELTEIDIS